MVLVSASTGILGIGDLKKVDASVFMAENHVLNMGSAIKSTASLTVNFPQAANVQAQSKVKRATKAILKKITALNLDGKLLAIKGFVEENTTNGETEISIDELTALNQFANGTPSSSTPAITTTATSGIVATEILVNIPPISEDPITLEEDGEIQEYVVVEGDTVDSISKKFNISADTILWANDLKRTSTIRVGQKLVVLPTTGVSYKIKAGDTVSEIADKFNISQRELVEFNDLQDGRLIIGDTIIIPGGTITPAANAGSHTTPVKNVPKSSKNDAGIGYFSRPMHGGIKTQGIHGHNGVDIAGTIGTPILAAREGTVTLVRGGSTWNGGYGNYVVVSHGGGVQTLYAHMNSITVNQGQTVSRGQQVGTLGNTGDSTGPHLHVEVRGAKNPF
ncbi:MAG: hypothetical protein RJB39_269 [Candidatus Parcubacteria bacterium]|jgi:murein DD-endopeptidase MepM/ murein hydrolase activator NlpD